MIKQIEALIRLQSVCDRIRKLNLNKELKNSDILRREKLTQDKKDLLIQEENKSKSFQMDIHRKELDLKAIEGEINKYKAQLNNIKTNKEYKALQDETKLKEADKSMLEDQILDMMGELENKKEASKRIEREVKDEKEQLGKFTETVKIDICSIDKEIEEVERQKARLLETLDRDVRYHFERLIKNKNGIAVAKVLNSVCQSCNYEVTSQTINILLFGKETVFCQSCGRILYLDNEAYVYQK